MTQKRYAGTIEKLRNPERIKMLELDKVCELSLEGLEVKTLLDVGTGTGVVAEKFSQKGVKVAGIDCNEIFLEVAKSCLPNSIFKKGVAEKLDFKDNSFDLVFMGHVLHEVDSLDRSMIEAARVARKRLAVLEWPVERGEIGPPADHRLAFEKAKIHALKAGFVNPREVRLDKMVLWLFDLEFE